MLARLRHGVEALLHPSRRRQARARVLASARPGQVLFLCQGNICRSPFAELLFVRDMNRVREGMFDATSAGFVGPNRRPPPDARAAAAKFGIDLTGHESKLVTTELVRDSVLVVAMSAGQARAIERRAGPLDPLVLVLGDLDPQPIRSRTIRDPWNARIEVFNETYARIERCVGELVKLMSSAL